MASRSEATVEATAFRPWNKSPEKRGALAPGFSSSPRTNVIYPHPSRSSNLTCVELAPQEIRTFFVTAVAANRRRLFQTDANANLLLDLFKDDRAKGRYQLHAFVLMPDHIHVLITPAENVSLEKAMQFIKGGFSFRLKSRMPVWEDSFTKRRIEDASDLNAHRDYIHANPVRAHLCDRAEDFPHSSANLTGAVDPMPAHLRA
ncbi:MAG TPA: transposase [Acidobacteriaceae bacterium]|nr:transposase [Acidobacteriaceae bacterium]